MLTKKLSNMPSYNDYIDRDDENVIFIDSSVESDIESTIISPEINDDCVVDLLRSDTPLQDLTSELNHNNIGNNGHRYSFKDIFRSLSFRGKNRKDVLAMSENIDTHIQDNKIDPESHSENIEPINLGYPTSQHKAQQEQSVENLKPEVENADYSSKQFYDNSKPMQYLQEKEDVTVLDNENLHRVDSNTILEPIASNLPNQEISRDGEACIVKSESPTFKNSLSRRFSIFSKKSKSSPLEVSPVNSFDENQFFKDFDYLNLLSQWRLPNYKLPVLIPNFKTLDSELKNKKKNTIYLFLDDLDHDNSKHNLQLKNEQNKNIEKFLYYPLSKPVIDKYFAENFDHEKSNKNLFLHSSESFLSNSTPRPDSEECNDNVPKSFKRTFNFSKILDVYNNNNENDLLDVSRSDVEFKKMVLSYDISGLMALQTNKTLGNLMTSWNIWVVGNDKSNSKKIRGQIFTKINDNEDLDKLQNNYNIIGYYVHKTQKTIYILRDNEKPLFHVKMKTRQYGEYVFIIPLEDANAVWNVTTFLLLAEKLITNVSGYNIIGLGWRGFTYKEEFGYHLTLIINDRLNFDKDKVDVLLSEFKTLIPESLKRHFEKCKTVYPGERKATVIDVI